MGDTDPQELPLREALIRWCDQGLVRRILLIESVVTIAESRELRLIRLGQRDGNRRLQAISLYAGILNRKTDLAAAWKELQDDFRRIIEQGDIELVGVSTWPGREPERRGIPRLWASQLWFDFNANHANIVEFHHSIHCYVAVVARSTTGASTAAAQNPTLPLPAADTAPAVRAARQSGRRPFSLDEVVQLATEMHGCTWPNQKVAAHELRKAYIERFRDRKPPSERTIIDHVAEIYTLSGRAASPENP